MGRCALGASSNRWIPACRGRVLAGVPASALAGAVQPDRVGRLLRHLAAEEQFVVADLGAAADPRSVPGAVQRAPARGCRSRTGGYASGCVGTRQDGRAPGDAARRPHRSRRTRLPGREPLPTAAPPRLDRGSTSMRITGISYSWSRPFSPVLHSCSSSMEGWYACCSERRPGVAPSTNGAWVRQRPQRHARA